MAARRIVTVYLEPASRWHGIRSVVIGAADQLDGDGHGAAEGYHGSTPIVAPGLIAGSVVTLAVNRPSLELVSVRLTCWRALRRHSRPCHRGLLSKQILSCRRAAHRQDGTGVVVAA